MLIGALAALIIGSPRFRGLDQPFSDAPFPAAPASQSDTITFDDFAGSDACAGCHQGQHAAWSRSTHGRAGQSPPGNLVLKPFNGVPIRFRDATIEPRVRNGTYQFVVQWADRTDIYPVLGVVGAAHMAGGGTQGFVWRHPDGTTRLLPFEIAARDQAWFCATSTRVGRGWRRITPEMSITDCNDWPPNRVFGTSRRYASCQECHGSQIESTRFQSLAINCEACHGPGKQHVNGADMPSLATLSPDAALGVCLRCHALKADLQRGYLPGRSLEDYYSLKLSLLGDKQYPDGRTRTFAYQQGHLYSDCYLSARMTCGDCHDPHTQQYRSIAHLPLNGRLADEQCTACHPSKAARQLEHTRHAAGSTGNRCVSCHMAYLQESAVGDDVHYTRSDHTIPVPRPAVDERLGAANACRTCHADKNNQQLADEVRAYWGELKPLRPAVAGLIELQEPQDLARVVIAADTTHPFAYFDALARYFATVRPDAALLPFRMQGRLWELTESRDDDVAALALAILHADRGNQRQARLRLIERLRQLGDRDLRVRRRWVTALAQQAGERRAPIFYEKALELQPDNADVVHAFGLLQLDQGQTARANGLLQRAVALDSLNSLAWINYGRARLALRDAAGAHAAFRRATEVNPADGQAFFFLGNSLATADRAAEAMAAYRRAVELDASLSAAHFNLARLLLIAGRDTEAMGPLRRGLHFDPANQEARQVLNDLGR